MRAQKLASKTEIAPTQASQLGHKEEREDQKVTGHQTQLLAGTRPPQGGPNLATAHAAILNRAVAAHPSQAPNAILQLQRHYGNQHVQRVLGISRQSTGDRAVAGDVEQTIHGSRGAGQSLDSGAKVQMESAFGADFSGVKVHTGQQADSLNQNLGARAFTTGRDIFFSRGEYSPGSSKGQELLAHELTHVVQQNGSGIRTKLTVSQPDDPFERQADQVAHQVMQKKEIARQSMEEDEEQMQLKRLPGVDANVFR